VVVMDLRVETVRWEATDRARDELEPGLRVDRRFVLGEDDERGALRVEARIHARRDLHSAREREPDVDLVAHTVRLERPADLRDDRLVRWDLREGERERGAAQAVEMLA